MLLRMLRAIYFVSGHHRRMMTMIFHLSCLIDAGGPPGSSSKFLKLPEDPQEAAANF
jgi:hypothetical protein